MDVACRYLYNAIILQLRHAMLRVFEVYMTALGHCITWLHARCTWQCCGSGVCFDMPYLKLACAV